MDRLLVRIHIQPLGPTCRCQGRRKTHGNLFSGTNSSKIRVVEKSARADGLAKNKYEGCESNNARTKI
jgi:hypothetical protein